MGFFDFLNPKRKEQEELRQGLENARTLASDEEFAGWWNEMSPVQQQQCEEWIAGWVPAGREVVRRLVAKFYHYDIARVGYISEWSALKKRYQEKAQLRTINETILKGTWEALEKAKTELAAAQPGSVQYNQAMAAIAAKENKIKECMADRRDYADLPQLDAAMKQLSEKADAATAEVARLHQHYPDVFEFTGYDENGYPRK